MKIGFVTPWFGENIPGGAEAELRELLMHLKGTNLTSEVLTTCVEKFSSNWNINFFKPGVTVEAGVTVRRFPVRKRNARSFDKINLKLMNNEMPLMAEEELIFVKEMINSPALYDYMRQNQDEYDLFVFIPYMFGTTYYGAQICPNKSILIPCFHDESYFYLNVFKKVYSNVRGIIYNAEPEKQLAEKYYDLSDVNQIVMGIGMDTDWNGEADRFRHKYSIEDSFILYAGRKDKGKNVDTLITYFSEYKKRNKTRMKLLLIGGGKIDIPKEMKSEIIDLGFLSVQDKYDAHAAATVLCQPSKNESFSYVIMDSWLAGKPVLVHEKCAVTKNFVVEANGGLYFKNYFEFEGAVDYILSHKKNAEIMGRNGKNYVENHFTWNHIIDEYITFFRQIAGKENVSNAHF